MKHKQQRNIKFAVMFVVLVGLVGFLVSEELTGNPNMGFAKTFSLPEMRTAGGSNSHSSSDNSNVSCDVKSTLYVLDNKGGNIKTVQSSMLSGSPLDLVNPSDNKPVSVFVVVPKIFCTTDNENITIKDSNLNLSLYGTTQTITESKKQPLNTRYTTSGGLGETVLGSFTINSQKIESNLPDSVTFQSDLRFDITGNINIVYDNKPSDVMTIPINANDIVTKWNYKSITDKPTTQDTDHDGIDDKYDQCPSTPETHNTYQDDDGCPDQVPYIEKKSTPVSQVPVITKDSCNAENRTWYLDSNDKGTCGSGRVLADSSICRVLDMSIDQCIDPKLGDINLSNVIDAEIKFQVYIKNSDNTDLDFQVADDPSPFSFDIPLTSLVGGIDGSQKATASFTVEPRLVIDDPKVHSLTDTKQSNLTIETIVKHDNKEYSLGEKRVSNFRTTNGGGFDSSVGFSLGSVKIMASEIQNKVPLDVIPMGSSDSVSVRFLVAGDIGIITKDFGTVKNIYDLDISGADFEITNLKIIRADVISIPTPPKVNCDDATENVITINGVPECIPKGSTQDDPLPPKLGQVGTFICQDDSVTSGGFPCTEEYRINYCGGKDSTFCNVPNDIIKPVIPDITPIDNDQCPNDSIQSLSVVNGMCLVTGGTTTTTGGESTTTGGNNDINLTPSDESSTYLLYGAIGIGVLGFIAFMIRKRN